MDKERLAKAFWLFPPRPVVLISTIDSLGNQNVAPHAEFIKLYTDQVLVAIEKDHDTYKNILETKEFVVGIPPISIARAVSISAKPFPRGDSEFVHAGLTLVPAKNVKASLIKECIANFECKLNKEMGTIGTEALIVGDVVEVSFDETKNIDEISSRLSSEALLHISKGRVFTTIKGKQVDTGIDFKKL